MADIFPYFGIAGALAVFAGCAFSALPFRGRKNEKYSPLNHFISELGEKGVSRRAAAFNAGLVACGLLNTVFMAGVALYFSTLPAIIAGILGMISSIAVSMIGIFPMNTMNRHMAAAGVFFYGTMSTVAAFIYAFVAGRRSLGVPPAITAVAGLELLLLVVFFLILGRAQMKGLDLDPATIERPAVWIHPLLEWLVMIGINAWIITLSVYIII